MVANTLPRRGPICKDNMLLQPMMGARDFAKWGINFVGPINPPTHRTRAQYIIVATDYLTKWVEAKATPKNDVRTPTWFLYECVFKRYNLPIEIVSDCITHFINEVVEYLLEEFMVMHKKSAPYHPQANAQAKSTNKILCTVLTKIVKNSRTDWELKLQSALWAYRVAYKTVLGTTPYNMVFGLDTILPLEFLIPTLRTWMEWPWVLRRVGQAQKVRWNTLKGCSRHVRSEVPTEKVPWCSCQEQGIQSGRFGPGDTL